MAWPGNLNWDNHGFGVDQAHPPTRWLGPFADPEFWQRCTEERGGWEEWHPEPQQGHGSGHRGGRRHGGRHSHGQDAEEHHDATDSEELIDDEEVAEAVADGEKMHEKEQKRDGADSPDTTTGEDTPTSDPPEGVPSEDEGRWQRSHSRRGRRGTFGHRGRGSFGPGGRGGHNRHGPGPRGFHHHGPHPPPPFFGPMFAGGVGPGGMPFFDGLFGEGPGPRGGPGGPHGRQRNGPPPPPFFGGLFGGDSGGSGPRGGAGGPGGTHGPAPPRGGPASAGVPFDFQAWLSALTNHPLAQNVREYLERAQDRSREGAGEAHDTQSFTPPVDLFEQQDRWVLHVAVPGAKKEDVGVSWDAGRSVLSVSGVVARPGDEEFLRGLVSGERCTGVFAREVRLPPAEGDKREGSKEEVDVEGIEARMEDGILVVTVPKVERWTEVKKVDIQ